MQAPTPNELRGMTPDAAKQAVVEHLLAHGDTKDCWLCDAALSPQPRRVIDLTEQSVQVGSR